MILVCSAAPVITAVWFITFIYLRLNVCCRTYTSLSAGDQRCSDSTLCGVWQSREINKYKLTCVNGWQVKEVPLWIAVKVVFLCCWGFFLTPWEWKAKAWVFSYNPGANTCFFDKHEDQKFLTSVFTIQSFEMCTCYHDLVTCTFHCTLGLGAVMCCMWWPLMSVFLKSS